MGALMAACAAPVPAKTGAPSPPPNATAATAIASDDWSKADWEDRHATMTWGVLPTMARKFQHFEKSAVPRLTCRTCHGADAEDRNYKMPNASLAALSPTNLPKPESSPIARFMHEEVVPEMRELTGSPTLSCFQCHPQSGVAR
jgi:hypothetical protein